MAKLAVAPIRLWPAHLRLVGEEPIKERAATDAGRAVRAGAGGGALAGWLPANPGTELLAWLRGSKTDPRRD